MYAAAAVMVIVAMGVGVWRAGLAPVPQATGPSASTLTAPRLSIVVLPFVNLSNEPDQEYFADGVTDRLTSNIWHRFGFVIARNTAFTYKGKAVDAKQIGRELGVRYILEGSVQRSANQIRINAQLIDAETGSHVWAESFDRGGGDLFTIEDVTKRIARSLFLQVVDFEARRAEQRGASADAMDYYMRGEALWYRPPITKDSYRAMAEMYGRALQLDEHLPNALLGLADALATSVLDGFSDAPEDDLRRADELVSKVLANEPNRSFAHRLKGSILRAQMRFEEATVEYETDIALDPTTYNGRSHLGLVKILIGEPAEAIPLLEQAMKISPRDTFSVPLMQMRFGLANLLLGNTDEAFRWYEKAVFTYYSPTDAYRNLAAALSLKGDTAGAQAALAKAAQYNPHSSTLTEVRKSMLSDRPKFMTLLERTLIEGLRKAGMPE
jgi:TolB-like protein/Flp pilus assembly protein TadD